MRGTASVCTVAVATAEGSVMSGEQTSREACPRPADVADGRAGEKSETRDSMQSRTESRNPTSLSTPSCSPMTGCSETDRHRLPKCLAVNYPQTKDLWALDVEKSSCIRHDNISHLSWVFTYPHVAMLRAALTSASATLPQCAQRKCLPCLMPM